MPVTATRRQFLKSVSAAAVATPWFWVPTHAKTVVRHASFGASGMAFADVNGLSKHEAFELVAVADVDLCRVNRLLQNFPKVRVYQNWRELLKKEARNLDSVNVSTPDHMHAIQAIEAMRLGKHVYIQKPLASTLFETRAIAQMARRTGVVTQMGIQTSSTEPQRYGEWLVRSGVVGKIREVHTFSNKSWGDDKPLKEGTDPVPPTLDWDLWLGVSAMRPFKNGAYHPGEWRRRVDFGTGTLGDMGCHIYSPPYRALELTSPTQVTASGPSPSDESWATRARVQLVYPGTRYTAGSTVDMWWYDGGELPPESLRAPVGDKLPDQGSIVVGTDGLLVLPHGGDPFLVGDRQLSAKPAEIGPRSHWGEFLDAILTGGTARTSASVEYSGPLTESVLIGNVAARFPGETLEFDAASLSFPKKPEANRYLRRSYRDGYRIKELRG